MICTFRKMFICFKDDDLFKLFYFFTLSAYVEEHRAVELK